MNLETAVEICRRVENIIVPVDAHCALTGSCLYRGESEKDIDIIIYSHQALKNPYNKQAVLNALVEAGLVDKSAGFYQTTPNYLDKDVVLCEVEGWRVDLFFFP